MGGNFDAWTTDDNEGDDESAELFGVADPLDALNKRDQDVFFRILDLIPDDKREFAMQYFFDHPAKIRSVIDHIKQDAKTLLKNQDKVGLQAVLDEENVDLDEPMSMGGNSDDSEEGLSTDEDNY